MSTPDPLHAEPAAPAQAGQSAQSGLRAALPLLSAWLATLLVLVSPLTYVALIDVPLLSRTAATVWIMIALAIAIGLIAMCYDRRTRTKIPFGLNALLGLLFVGAFVFLPRLPAPSADLPLVAADFALPDQTGRQVSLAELTAGRGAVLVFYRGFW